jgi:hypothetical protein
MAPDVRHAAVLQSSLCIDVPMRRGQGHAHASNWNIHTGRTSGITDRCHIRHPVEAIYLHHDRAAGIAQLI